jgi:putative hydrolase
VTDADSERNDEQPEDFAEFLRAFIENQGGIDAEQLAKAAGLPNDPELLKKLIGQFESAMKASETQTSGGVNWTLAQSQAKSLASKEAKAVSDTQRKLVADAVSIGSLWLDDVTDLAASPSDPKLLNRELWVADALPLFQELSKPVAERMATALTETMQSVIPEELQQMNAQAGAFMRSAGGAMFAMQLGQALGKLATETLSGGDTGIPILRDRAALVPQNIDEFLSGFDIGADQGYIFLTIRELAYSRLFRNAKWLRDAVVSQITQFASEIAIDTEHLREVAESLDLNDPEQLRGAIDSGAMIAKRTEDQERAVSAIENLLALIDGWVECVTEDATTRLPNASSIAEAIIRRRAEGGPAEVTFGTLVGLQLRPRKLREARELWRILTREFGTKVRDEIWLHPDQLPTAEEIENPLLAVARLRNDDDDFDRALQDFLQD